ncbi:MAG: transglycosylase SLT domain-containing protein [Syntrophobacteraceae bacterium]
MAYLEDDRVTLCKGSIDRTGAKIYGKKATVPKNYVVELQKDLQALRFVPGSADGFFGTRTDEALRAFQEAALGDRRIKDGKAITVSPSYKGGIHGECDSATRREIKHWIDRGYQPFWPLPPIWKGPEEPLQENEIAFAEPSPFALYWPIRTRERGGREVAYQGKSKTIYGRNGRRFLAGRSNGRYHVGVDLWAEAGDVIVACEDGEIVNHYHFYNNLHALIVQCASGIVINYGEVRADSWKDFALDTGSQIKAGQPIAVVGRMINDSMCHFETYRKGTLENCRYYMGKRPPYALLNPTKYLLHLAAKEYLPEAAAQPEAVLPPPPPPPVIEVVSRPQDIPFVRPENLPNFSSLDRYHEAFPGGIRWRLTPLGMEVEGSGIERTPGEPKTITKIWESFGDSINKWAERFKVPCVLILATIATETMGKEDSIRFEPGYISDEKTPHRVSPGLMQTLISTARSTLKDKTIDRNRLLIADNSIQAGTCYIAEQRKKTGYDPPKVACAYNAGGIYKNTGSENRWKMKQYPIGQGEHCDRFVCWFNDAVDVLTNHKKKSTIPYEVYLA